MKFSEHKYFSYLKDREMNYYHVWNRFIKDNDIEEFIFKDDQTLFLYLSNDILVNECTNRYNNNLIYMKTHKHCFKHDMLGTTIYINVYDCVENIYNSYKDRYIYMDFNKRMI